MNGMFNKLALPHHEPTIGLMDVGSIIQLVFCCIPVLDIVPKSDSWLLEVGAADCYCWTRYSQMLWAFGDSIQGSQYIHSTDPMLSSLVIFMSLGWRVALHLSFTPSRNS